jgi:hypothetical protein
VADQRTTLPKRYQVPTHLQVVDKIAIGPVSVTIRQGAILLFGAALAYQCWHGLALLSDGGLGWLRVLMAGVLFGLSVALAQVRLSGRHLELWAVVWVRYRWQPRVYVWQHLPLRLTDAHSAQKGKP